MQEAEDRTRKRRLVAYFVVVVLVLLSMPFACYSDRIQGIVSAEGRDALQNDLQGDLSYAWDIVTTNADEIAREEAAERDALLDQDRAAQRSNVLLWRQRTAAGESLGAYNGLINYGSPSLERLPSSLPVNERGVTLLPLDRYDTTVSQPVTPGA